MKSKFISRIEKETIDKGNSRGETNEREKSLSIKFKRLKTAYEDHLTEVLLLFYTACLPLFTSSKFFLWRANPLAHKVYPMSKELIRKIASRFLEKSCYHGEDIIDEDIIDDTDN